MTRISELRFLVPKKKGKRKEIRIFLRGFSFWQNERKYIMKTTRKYLLCIEKCAHGEKSCSIERLWQTIRHNRAFSLPLWWLYAIRRHWMIITSSVEYKESRGPEGQGLSWWQCRIITGFHRLVSLPPPIEFIWGWRRGGHFHVLHGG